MKHTVHVLVWGPAASVELHVVLLEAGGLGEALLRLQVAVSFAKSKGFGGDFTLEPPRIAAS